MSDSDDYDESSDEDYVPKAEEVSEEEESGEDEDFDPAADDGSSAANGAGGASTKKGKRKKRGEIIKRERKGGIKLEGEAEEDSAEDEEERKEKEEKDKIINKEVEKEMELMKEKEETKKIDDLWSSFLSDVKQKPKSAMASKSSACSSTSTPASSGSLASLSKPVSSSPSPSSTKLISSASNEKKPEKVTITKIFDFAGEEVRVTKEVAADSKEAKAATKEQTSEDEKESPASSSPGPGVSGVKRPAGGLGSVLGKIGKKSKISVLNSSKDKETVGNFDDLGTNTACDQMENLQSENQMDVIANSHKSLKRFTTASLIVAEQNSERRDEPIKQLGRFSCRSNCEGMCVCFMPRKSRILPSPPRHDDPLDKFLKDRENDLDSDDEPSLQIRSILNLT